MNVVNFPRMPVAPQVDENGLVYSGESARGGHQLECAMACPRKWALKYPLRVPRVQSVELDTKKVPAYVLGNVVHQWCANYYAARAGFLDVAAPDDAARIRAQSEGYAEAAERACQLAADYTSFVKEAYPSWVPVAEEIELLADFGEGRGTLTLGVDQIFWCERTEQPIVVDWKTAGRIANAVKYPYSTQYMRYRMALRAVARQHGKADSWGKVFVGLIPTGKTNFHRRDLVDCPYFAAATDGIEQQTGRHLAFLTELEQQEANHVVRTGAVYGPECAGLYSPCQFRNTHCFMGGNPA